MLACQPVQCISFSALLIVVSVSGEGWTIKPGSKLLPVPVVTQQIGFMLGI